jgi:signal transduction histidine kinase
LSWWLGSGLLLVGLGVGWLVGRRRITGREARARMEEAERLRDALGRRVDVLEASNRCARALASSLQLDEAFDAFMDELRGLIPFDRAAILLVEDDAARVIATAGLGADSTLAPGTAIETAGSVVERVLEGRAIYRETLDESEFAEERALASLGLRSRIVSPLQLGTGAIGALTLARVEQDAFTPEEIELATLLGRFAAAAVQNIRTYEAERATVEELRRLSSLRADFVSLVSHELRSPMAAVIGSARTLQSRWRELRHDQREAFLAVIGDETSRLAALIGDVLDTSRIEAGTFGYTFTDVDLADVVRDAAAAAELGQDEIRFNLELSHKLPPVRGDRDRLRQIVDNLVSNALKYSENGAAVDIAAVEKNGSVLVRVRDRGPGIAGEDQQLIFEKFGRADVRNAKPGTGLGLFIARAFAEAHGGTVLVDSQPGEGATFTLAIPAGRATAEREPG